MTVKRWAAETPGALAGVPPLPWDEHDRGMQQAPFQALLKAAEGDMTGVTYPLT